MDPWLEELTQGSPERAWDQFLTRYRRLLFAAIRHYVRDHDDVMDAFTSVCQALRDDDFRRLRAYADQAQHRARFSTWLVTVTRRLTIDWLRRRDGRHRLPAFAANLPPLRRRIFELVFVDGHGHDAALELIRGSDWPELGFHEFQVELRATYRAVSRARRGRFLPVRPIEVASDAALEVVAEPAGTSGSSHPAADELERALTSLPAADRTLLELYLVEDLSAADVARVLGLPNAKAVYNRANRLLASLRAELGEWAPPRESS